MILAGYHLQTYGLPSPFLLGAIYGISEIALAISRRSAASASKRDRYSLLLLWAVIGSSIYASLSISYRFPSARLPDWPALYLAGLLLFIAGLILRWSAIIHLGRFFTVDVAIAREHRVVETGPYRWLRHPSYTGSLLAFLGFGLCLGNYLSIIALLLPVTAAFLWRIHVEERALLDALDEAYRNYMQRTKRLIPFVY
jgi:protein-S-isoprenylcysteine O-methyltransferase